MHSSTRSAARPSALLRALREPVTYGASAHGPSVPVQLHETHASWVFVAGERAYKLKKPLVLPFLDYGTAERRHAACREEVRVNAELAPDIYLGVRAVARRGGRFALAAEDAPDAVDYLVEMRTFREADTLAGMIAAGALEPQRIGAVARRIAEFHLAAPRVDGWRAPDVLAAWEANVRELAQARRDASGLRDAPSLGEASGLGEAPGALSGGAGELELRSFGAAFVSAHEREIDERSLAGMVRDCHGDLRCEHVLADGEVRIVDRIEFDPALRRTDVACDLAFLAMDLEASGRRGAAEDLVAEYAAAGGDPGSAQLRAFYSAHRALVRAKVALIAAAEHEGERARRELSQASALLELAGRLCWRARAPLAALVCGPAASGKTTLARALAARSGLPHVSSDAVRKQAAGVAAGERAPDAAYSPEFTRDTYRRLSEEARRALRSRGGVVIDATCRSRTDREPLIELLRREGTTALAVRCTVPLEVAMRRAAERSAEGPQLSDATAEIAAQHHRGFEELEELDAHMVLALDTCTPLPEQLSAVESGLDRNMAGAPRKRSARERPELQGCGA